MRRSEVQRRQAIFEILIVELIVASRGGGETLCQLAYQHRMARLDGKQERRQALLGSSTNVGTVLDQQSHHVDVTDHGGRMEWCLTESVCRIDFGLLAHQQLDAICQLQPCGLVEIRSALAIYFVEIPRSRGRRCRRCRRRHRRATAAATAGLRRAVALGQRRTGRHTE